MCLSALSRHVFLPYSPTPPLSASYKEFLIFSAIIVFLNRLNTQYFLAQSERRRANGSSRLQQERQGATRSRITSDFWIIFLHCRSRKSLTISEPSQFLKFIICFSSVCLDRIKIIKLSRNGFIQDSYSGIGYEFSELQKLWLEISL